LKYSIKELAELGDKIKGKIVFFNRPMDNEEIESFMRIQGLVIREILVLKQQSFELSGLLYALNLRLDDFPHTGAQIMAIPKSQYIPTAAISTNGAELLSKTLKIQI
jgi:hypothetical protein